MSNRKDKYMGLSLSDLDPTDAIKSGWDSVKDAGSKLTGWVKDGVEFAGDLVEDVADGVVNLAESIVDEIGDLGQSIWDEARRVGTSLYEEQKRFVNKNISAPWPNPTQTAVATSITRVLEDENQPRTVEETMINSVLLKRKDITGQLLNAIKDGPNLKVGAMYEYAQTDYAYGLPNGNSFTEYDAAKRAETLLTNKEGFPVQMDYFLFQPPNHTHIGWVMLMDNYGYDPKTNRIKGIEASLDADVAIYLEAIIPVIPGDYLDAMPANQLLVNGRSASSAYSPNNPYKPVNAEGTRGVQNFAAPRRGADGSDHKVTFRYSFENPDDDKGIVTGDVTANINELFVRDVRYYQCKYSFDDAGETQYRYWIYSDGGGKYPSLDGMFMEDGPDSETTYLPIIPFRKNFENLTDPSLHDTNEYKTSKEISDILGFDYQTIGDEVHKNPDIDKVKQAVMMFGVPIISDNQVDLEYLWQFFKQAYEVSKIDNGPLAASSLNDIEGLITIKDAGFKISINHRAIRQSVRKGNIGSVGTLANTTGSDTFTRTVQQQQRDGSTTSRTETVSTPLRKFAKQISSRLIEEYVVADPRLVYEIANNYDTVAEFDSEKFLVPVDKKIADEMSYFDREKLYFRSLHMIFNSKQTKEGKWYERKEFQFVLFIAAIVLTVLSWGATWGWAASLGLGLAGTIAVFALVVVGLPYLATKIAAEIGAEETFVVALILAVVAYYTGSISEEGFLESFWAQSLMMSATSLVAGANVEIANKLTRYNNRAQEFEDLKEEKYEELEKQKEMLGLVDVDSLIDPMAFIGQIPKVVIGEGPQQFYYRTVHSGNIGTLAYDAIENFVSASLKLPGIDDTTGDQFNV